MVRCGCVGWGLGAAIDAGIDGSADGTPGADAAPGWSTWFPAAENPGSAFTFTICPAVAPYALPVATFPGPRSSTREPFVVSILPVHELPWKTFRVADSFTLKHSEPHVAMRFPVTQFRCDWSVPGIGCPVDFGLVPM